MVKPKKLSNPFSTGNGGAHFEAHVQASFVVLMLTGGFAPCLPCWPIVEIRLQGRIDGSNTDDLIIFIENTDNRERLKLLVQIKHSISITQNDKNFREVIQAAWKDFNDQKNFTKGKDRIALITGPLSATDTHTVRWLLDQARCTKNADEFYRHTQEAKFSSHKSKEKLQVIQSQLNIANDGIEVSREELYDFLKHFYLLGYDLGSENGVILSLLYSHMSQFQLQYPQDKWSRVVEIVQTWNQNAGTITRDNLPEDLLETFKHKFVTKIPEEFNLPQERSKTDWAQYSEATYLALANLIGSWNEKSKNDIELISKMLGISYDDWLRKARELIQYPDSPLVLKNGIWKVVNRAELWKRLGSRILDQNLDTFRYLAVDVLKEPNPAFQLPSKDRFAASIYGKVLKHSNELRNGIAEGLAILGSQPEVCNNCSLEKAKIISVLIIRDLFTSTDWSIWGSLNNLLPDLAEAAPDEFLDVVEKALHQSPCPFDELFTQESNGIYRQNYLTGLLWSLEGLAWEEQYIVRVCIVLGELANHDPGGQSGNRPADSLTTILLPWLPQTLASFDKRKVVVQTLFNEWPDVAWKLVIRLLPGQRQATSGSHKPKWRRKIPEVYDTGVSGQEYWQQVLFYAEFAVKIAGYNPNRLSTLIDHLDKLPKPAFEQLLEVLNSQTIFKLPEDQRLLLWNHLTNKINQHRRNANAKWALPDEFINKMKKVAEQLAPTNPVNLYQHLFIDEDFELYEEGSNWKEQEEKLNKKRVTAITEIFQQNGWEGVIHFAESTNSPEKVGLALGVIEDEVLEQKFLPLFLATKDNNQKAFINGFIWKRYQNNGWGWCDKLDKSGWTPKQIAHFLSCLPFSTETWDRASEWLKDNQKEYWSLTNANPYQAEKDLPIAIDKLIEFERPHAAIRCLERMCNDKQPINVDQCIRALFAALSSSEPTYAMDGNNIVELIKYLQLEPSVNQEDLCKIEWAYLQILDENEGSIPKFLENRLARDPEFFCQIIRLIYRSRNENQPLKEPTEEIKAMAANGWLLLHKWRTPPGLGDEKTFDAEHFYQWLQRVKILCEESGHLVVALIHIGEVLVHAPPDPDGLWIHRAVATVLNERDADEIREGYSTGTFNLRDVHWVDPTGQPEKELADQFRRKAEEIENAGFHRFAVTLRDLAEGYEREAKQIIDEHKSRVDDQQ